MFGEKATLRNMGMFIRDDNVLIAEARKAARAAELANPVGASVIGEEVNLDFVAIANQDDALRAAIA